MFDKTASCLNCPDRELYCHSACEGYIQRTIQRQKLNQMAQERIAEYEFGKSVRSRIAKVAMRTR